VVFGPDHIHSFSDWHRCNPGAVFVGHNILSFDVRVINRLIPGANIDHKQCVDTLILSQLYHPKMPNGHSLGAWGERLRFPKGDFSDFSQYSDLMLDYCIRDCDLCRTLYIALSKRMAARGFSEASVELEHRIHLVIDKQMANGWHFDAEAAVRLHTQLRNYERELEEPIRKLFPPVLQNQGTYNYRVRADGTPYASYSRHLFEYPQVVLAEDQRTYEVWDWQEFNIGSPVQRINKLLSLGWKPEKFTKKGNPSVDEDSLVEFAKSSGRTEVQAIADWLVANGRANMIETWLDNVQSDGRIHGRVMSCGAASRRMTHSGPNTANIPSNEAKYGHECRSLWTVDDPGRWSIVGTDAKSIQMRCYSAVLPDPEAGRRYWDTELCADPHQENADLIGIGRRPVKNVFYANLFGAYPPKLAVTAGKAGSKAELKKFGEWIKEQLYEVSPGLREATEAAQAEWNANDGFLKCIDGGYVRCPAASAAFNYKIQPAEAVIMKTASVLIDERLRKGGYHDVLKIGDIHDEIQFQTPVGQEREVGELCVQGIRDAGESLNFRVPLDGNYAVGKSWAGTH